MENSVTSHAMNGLVKKAVWDLKETLVVIRLSLQIVHLNLEEGPNQFDQPFVVQHQDCIEVGSMESFP